MMNCSRTYIYQIFFAITLSLYITSVPLEAKASYFPSPVLQKYTTANYYKPRPTPRPTRKNTNISLPEFLEYIEKGETLFSPRPTRKQHRFATPVYKPSSATGHYSNGNPTPVLKASAPGSFIWPLEGKILSRFGDKPGGLKNHGINIATSYGSAVRATADGNVVYVGNKLKGYGKLLLIHHNGGWISAYAHNKDILVSEGDNVHQGQVISHAGKSGKAAKPQLFFALRKHKKPVNPEHYLPRMFSSAR